MVAQARRLCTTVTGYSPNSSAERSSSTPGSPLAAAIVLGGANKSRTPPLLTIALRSGHV
jgi:hypothetical protein